MGSSQTGDSVPMQIRVSHHFLNNPTLLTIDKRSQLRICCGVEELEYERWQNNLKHCGQYPMDYILIPIRSVFSKSGICSSIGNAEIYYEKYCYLISEEIHHRNGRKVLFQETEIWLLLYKIVKAEHSAKESGELLGDVRPNNIFLNEQGSLKIASQFSWPQATTAFEKGMQKLPGFVSPQDMENLAKGRMQSSNKEASEMFSIGLTLLSAINLSDYEELYNMNDRNFYMQQFRSALMELKEKSIYSEILRSTVLNLCSLDPLQRVNLQQLEQLLFKHQANILALKSFVIDTAPSKLHKQVLQLRAFIKNNPILFASPRLLSQIGGSGVAFPQHLNVHKITPQYGFQETTTIIRQLE